MALFATFHLRLVVKVISLMNPSFDLCGRIVRNYKPRAMLRALVASAAFGRNNMTLSRRHLLRGAGAWSSDCRCSKPCFPTPRRRTSDNKARLFVSSVCMWVMVSPMNPGIPQRLVLIMHFPHTQPLGDLKSEVCVLGLHNRGVPGSHSCTPHWLNGVTQGISSINYLCSNLVEKRASSINIGRTNQTICSVIIKKVLPCRHATGGCA